MQVTLACASMGGTAIAQQRDVLLAQAREPRFNFCPLAPQLRPIRDIESLPAPAVILPPPHGFLPGRHTLQPRELLHLPAVRGAEHRALVPLTLIDARQHHLAHASPPFT